MVISASAVKEAAALGLVLVASARRAGSHDVSSCEEHVFRAVNRADDRLYPAGWTVMQSGSLAAVYAAASLQGLRNRGCGAPTTAAVGTAVWIAVKAAKQVTKRGRPDQHLDAVVVRGRPQTGRGFPSGHAAVATSLALMTTSTRSGRLCALAVAAITGVTRVYVGAHLPLDVVGGYAIGGLAGVAGIGRSVAM